MPIWGIDLNHMKRYQDGEERNNFIMIDQPTHLPKFKQISVKEQVLAHTFYVKRQLWDRIKRPQNRQDRSMQIFLISAWAVLLWRYNHTDELIFAVMLDKEPIPIRLHIDGESTVVNVIKQVEQALLIGKKLSFPSEQEGSFDHLLMFSEIHPDLKKDMRYSGVSFYIRPQWHAEALQIEMLFSTKSISSFQAHQIFIHLQNILNHMISYPYDSLKDINILTPEEQKRILTTFNQTAFPLPQKTVDHLFEEQVAKHAQKAAIVAKQEVLTYQELHLQSNRLAHFLIKKGVRRGQIVGLFVDQSPWMVIGILGIIKAGAAFLPIDTSYPIQRINYILQDSKVNILLSETGLQTPQKYHGQTIFLDQIKYQESSQTPVRKHGAKDPVYVIYTSGSTGYPKGVIVEHGALINLVTWHNQYYQITADDVSTKYAGLGFDASVWEVFPYLVAGATIHILPKAIRMDLEALHSYYEQHRVTVSFLPTPVAEQFMKKDNQSLRLLLTGGDQLRHIKQQSYRIANNYGPTENTVVTTSGFVEENQSITIGKPIYNNQVFILNRFNQPQPIGVAGELCISGASLARGYLNRSELTAEKFVEHPFLSGKRLYRTGDLARWLPDGSIEYLGRMDQQVKIRGYRIELGEIEVSLMRHEQVKEAAVTVENNEQQEPILCAYIVCQDADGSLSDIKTYLKKELPDYMIPQCWMKLDQIPLTPHGKIDKKLLPKISQEQVERTFDQRSLNPIEEKLYHLWGEVLGKTPASKDAHFFQMGGQSLKAMVLLTRIRQELGVNIAWADIFTYPTFQELANFIQKAQRWHDEPIARTGNNPYYPVSPVQRQLFALEQARKMGTTYHTPIVWLIEGELDFVRLQQSIQELINRHEVFRTTFHYVQGELMQQIHDEINWTIKKLKASDEQEAMQMIATLIRPFELLKHPLFRVGLIEISSTKHLLILDLHHLICDGISMGILYREFAQLYQQKQLPALSYQYKDYAVWIQKQLDTNRLQTAKDFWLNQFSTEIPVLNLPTDDRRPAQPRFNGEKLRFSIDAELVERCKRFCDGRNVTLYMTLLTVYFILLAKMSSQESIVVGTVANGRSRSEWETVVGMFVNTVPLLAHPRKTQTFEQLLDEVKQQLCNVQEYGSYPFAELVEKLGVNWDQRRNPLFDTVFILQNMEIPDIQIPDLKIKDVQYENKQAKFDLTWELYEQQDEIEIVVEYNTHLFRQQTVYRMVNHFIHILKQALVDSQKTISSFELITEAEKTQILTEFNSPEQANDTTDVLKLFAKQVKRNPNQPAVVAGERSISYQELDQESNKLAHYLRKRGIRDEQIVSIVADASIEFVIGIMAIIKAGGAFLPIDPAHPVKRIQYMLEDSSASVILGQAGVNIPKHFENVVCLNRKVWERESASPLSTKIDKHQLAYVIYTSGSTGKPKGVMIEHGALLNLVLWHHHYYQVTADDRSTKYAGVGFDASVWEIFPYLTKGASIYLVDPQIRHDLVALNQFFEKNRITISFLPTAIAESFMELENRSLRLLLVGGDYLKRVRQQNYTVVNNYGPTENTVVTTSYVIENKNHDVIPIGRPIRNQQVYILNQDLQLQPIGVPGELCISGEGLARGYLNCPELTKEKFLPSPFEKGKRIYRSGDLARWLPDGNIEYLGRMDQQVQIRGNRVELGEIETLLFEHPNVKEAIVMMQQEKDHSDPILCAYVIGDRKNLEAELKEYLKKELPDYMIPIHFIQMESFPLTVNGKIDRKSLPKPIRDAGSSSNYRKPTNSTQQLLVQIWQEVLQHSKIGIDDNFFSLGGDSIKAMQIAARLLQHRKKVAVHHLLEYPTIAALSEYVSEQNESSEQQPITGEIPLTPIQKYFFEQKFEDKHHWNQAIMISNEQTWDRVAIGQAFHRLICHHDSLRMRFREVDGEIQAVIGEPSETFFTIESFQFDEAHAEEKIQEQANRLQGSFDLYRGPLIRLAIFETKVRHELLIIIHHLLIDGVSWRILLDDFFYLYRGYVNKEERELPPKTTSYPLWSKRLIEYANSSECLSEVPFWTEMEKRTIQPLFPMDQTWEQSQLQNSESIEFSLTKAQTTWLLEHVHQAYHTEINDLLLAGLCLALKEWAQVDRVTLHLEGHGRETLFEDVDLTRTIGWFTSIYPVVFDLSSASLPYMIKSAKETLRSIPNKGIGYGILRYLTARKNKPSLRFSLQPEISFNYLGQFPEGIRFAGMGSEARLLGECFAPTSPMHPLEIYGAVFGGQLQFQFRFDRNACERVKMQRLADLYHHFLVKIMDHCKDQKDIAWTPSDFSASDVSLDELDQFLESLD